MKYNKWMITKEKEVKIDENEIREYFIEIEKLLGKKKMKKLAYGKVKIVKTLGKFNAMYNREKDIIEVCNKVIKKKDYGTLIHELGHRYFFTADNSTLRYDVFRKYYNLTLKENEIKIGSIIFDRFYHLSFKVLSQTKKKIKLKHKKGIMNINKNYLLTDFYQIVGKPYDKDSSYFSTLYSLTNSLEMFAELFSYWVIGKIKNPAKKWFERLIKS